MVLEGKHKEFYNKAKLFMERKRLVTDPVGTYAYGTDASFYRLIPQIVAFADGEDEVQKVR
jgi:D-lactate dehydrogenase